MTKGGSSSSRVALSSDGSNDGLVDGVDVGEGLSSLIMVYPSSSKLVLDDLCETTDEDDIDDDITDGGECDWDEGLSSSNISFAFDVKEK